MKHWIVFDGPVDALWIENMNSVLDDSQTLCLANSERIKLRNELRMIFEVQDLAVASPATVSRCGMVYMSVEDLSWEVMVDCWMKQKFGNDTAKWNTCLQIKTKTSTKINLDKKYQDQINNLFYNGLGGIFTKVRNFDEDFKTMNQ